ncbi:MAG: efflux RND transporter periplasmic adaptor subunit [Armatimonadota bacterium]|nr:efflux RND transporter periplasmic adaptor subunit [Armatimonadota bacterium]MDR7457452.1 efflux RND transporter periplasmic adaptor subunit [Armatimonadota bacterium]MDR7496557.1 efflux RND transporter periplasmic adaptor subunit [Armatimonadota bacterium]
MPRLLRTMILLAVAGVVIFGATQWLSRRPAAQQSAAAPQSPAGPPAGGPRAPGQGAPRAPIVLTTVVEPEPLVEQDAFPADVRASATADVTSRIAGRLGALLVREGSFVAAGGLVARIDDPELELAVRQADAAVDVQRARLAQLRAGPRSQEVAQVEAQVAQARTSLAQAERELARNQQLFADGFVARAVVDRSQTDVDLARQRLRAAEEQLALVKQGPRVEDIQAQEALVRQAQVAAAAARARLRDLRITSPIAGVVTRVNVERGSVISSQTVLASVATIRPVEVHVPLPETDLPRLRPTTTVRLQVDAFPGRTFEGRIVRIAPALDAASRSARAVVVLPNPDGALRPGMFARATVVFDTRQALLIPSDAITRRGEAVVVFVVKDGVVEERPVTIGYVAGGRSEIVAGLRPGEAIVTAGQQGLRDGMPVTVGRPAGPARPGAPGENQPRVRQTPGARP